MLELTFVMDRGQNWFFHDLVATLRDELARLGILTSLSLDGFPDPSPDVVPVLVPPHEYVALAGDAALPDQAHLDRTIGICAEQPSSVHFAQNIELCRRMGATFDINARSVRLLRGHGVDAEHLRIGHARRWDHYEAERERDLDVVFLGSHSPRRSRHLASYARSLSSWNCSLRLSDNSRPNPSGSTAFVADEEKWSALSRSKILINLHQGDEPYFEWLRVLDAMHAGAVIVSEHSTDFGPLEPGKHFFTGRPESLGLIADALLREEGEKRLHTTRAAAYELLVDELPLEPSLDLLIATATELAKQPVSTTAPPRIEPDIKPFPRRFDPPAHVSEPGTAAIRAALKDIRLDLLDLRRGVARAQKTAAAGSPPPSSEAVWSTSAWRGRRSSPVSVVTALYNHAHFIGPTLDSLLGTDRSLFEIVVVDDGSGDGSAEAAMRWMQQHDHIAARLMRHPVNRGLGAARNTAVATARGEYCFVLDADNLVRPACLPSLKWALDGMPDVAFAYPMIEAFGQLDAYIRSGGDPIISRYGWEPERLRLGNFVDAMAMIRRSELVELGGYTTDRRLYGWEDYDLWCRMAESGRVGTLVPQLLAQYRASPTSMLSLSNISQASAVAAVVERYPRLMAGIEPPM